MGENRTRKIKYPQLCYPTKYLLTIIDLLLRSYPGRLNWWAEVGACRMLFPMSTKNDGNSLLHAASLGMWGFHDIRQLLRNALHKLFLHPEASRSLLRRWKYRLWRENITSGGLNYIINKWDHEWNIVINLASDQPSRVLIPHKVLPKSLYGSRDLSYETAMGMAQLSNFKEIECFKSLEPIHVYGLSVLLCRPIIVVAEDMLADLGNPIAPKQFGGIYLPLERKPKDCIKYPLVLAHNNAHFLALVPADNEIYYKKELLSNSVPLYDKSLCLLPLRFALDPGSNWDLIHNDRDREEKTALTYVEKLYLLRQYLDVIRVTMKLKKTTEPLMNTSKQPPVFQTTSESAVANVQDTFPDQPNDELLAAKINTKELPKHYNDMINNYITYLRNILKERS